MHHFTPTPTPTLLTFSRSHVLTFSRSHVHTLSRSMIRVFIFIWLLCTHIPSRCQVSSSAMIYPEHILLAEEAMGNEDFERALHHYHALVDAGKQLMAKDAFHACQLAAMLDASDFATYFVQCAKAGVPEKLLSANLHIWPRMNIDTTSFNKI